MIEHRHPLVSPAPGTSRELRSLHFGPQGSGAKAVIQASLHADEVPPLLVAHHLRRRLGELEAAGRLRGEVVLLPFANPVGLSQWVLQAHEGRFDLASGQNFNRYYPDLVPPVTDLLAPRLAAGGEIGVSEVRAALRSACAALPAETELQSLRRTLLTLAADADVLLDLHCDSEAALHLYTATPLWPVVEPLARLTGSRAALLAEDSGDECFDEACSMVWPRLAAELSRRAGHPLSLPYACVAVTVELRGERDVTHELAAADAEALVQFLVVRGLVDGAPPRLPELVCRATPLAGSMPVTAPHGGVLVHLVPVGADVRRGERVAEIVDPAGNATPLDSPVDGVLYAREARRWIAAGTQVAKVAGREALRSGKLLSA